MALTGDFNALAAFHNKIKSLKGVSREIALKVSPVIEPLVDASMAAGGDAYGAGWVPKKGGGQALAGSTTGGRVLVRLVGTATIRTSLLYPYHFHDGGTRRVGRKRMAAIRRAIVGSATRLATADIKVPKKKKGESPYAYNNRVAATMARAAARKEAVQGVKNRVSFAQQEARAAGGMHDPERPIIPREEQGIPSMWEKAIKAEAIAVMAKYGATEKR